MDTILSLSVSGAVLAGAVFYILIKKVKGRLKRHVLRSFGKL